MEKIDFSTFYGLPNLKEHIEEIDQEVPHASFQGVKLMEGYLVKPNDESHETSGKESTEALPSKKKEKNQTVCRQLDRA